MIDLQSPPAYKYFSVPVAEVLVVLSDLEDKVSGFVEDIELVHTLPYALGQSSSIKARAETLYNLGVIDRSQLYQYKDLIDDAFFDFYERYCDEMDAKHDRDVRAINAKYGSPSPV